VAKKIMGACDCQKTPRVTNDIPIKQSTFAIYPDEDPVLPIFIFANAIPSQDNGSLMKSKQNGEASKHAGCDNTKTI
jgi:hypothetical protein